MSGPRSAPRRRQRLAAGLALLAASASVSSGCWPFLPRGAAESRWDVDGDGVARPSDCDDRDPSAATAVAWCRDADGDGAGDPSTAQIACRSPGEPWVEACGDCDDGDPGRADDCATAPPTTGDTGPVVDPGCEGPLTVSLALGRGAVEVGVAVEAAAVVDGDAVGAVAFTYDWGDGSAPQADAQASVGHPYAAPGRYLPAVTAVDGCGRVAVADGWLAVSAPGALLEVTTAADEGDPESVDAVATGGPWLGAGLSLREALELAAAAPGAQVVTFAAGLPAVQLGSGMPALSDPDGALVGAGGSTPLDGASGGRIEVSGARAWVAGLALSGFVDPIGAVRLSGDGSGAWACTVDGSAGPGVAVDADGAVVSGLTLTGNGGAGAQLTLDGAASVDRLVVRGGSGAGISVSRGGSGSRIALAQVYGQVGDGIGVDSHVDDLSVVDATIVGNGGDGVALASQDDAVDLRNLIVAFNGGWGVGGQPRSFPGEGPAYVAWWANGLGDCEACDASVGWLAADPLLVDVGAGLLAPAPGSPVIDAGVATGTDRTGALPGAWLGDAPDLGALEPTP